MRRRTIPAGSRRKNRRGICESCLQRFHVRLAINPGEVCEFEGNKICTNCGEPHVPGKYAETYGC